MTISSLWSHAPLQTFRKNVLDRPVESLNTGWEDTLVPLGMQLAGQAFGDAEMTAWAEAWSDYHLGAPYVRDPSPDYRVQNSGQPTRGVYLTPYCGEWGCAMAFAALPETPARHSAVKTIADHIISGSIRIGDGVIAHAHWSKLVWVDTLYYSAAPLARAFVLTGEERYAQEAVQQCRLHARYLQDPRTGLFFHEADPDTGKRTSWFWARGNGWIIMALADTLALCPPSTPGWDEVLRIYREQVSGLLRLQHGCGLWRIVPENEESHLETSGSIMIATGIVAGVARGWLDDPLGVYALRTWNEALTWIDAQGRLMGCQTPAGMGGWETHKRSVMGERTYGTGSLLRLAADLRLSGLI